MTYTSVYVFFMNFYVYFILIAIHRDSGKGLSWVGKKHRKER